MSFVPLYLCIKEKIRTDLLSTVSENGHFEARLPTERELESRYGVSRPTLRQAAALVGQEQLLHVRRGVGGGYFARRPDTRASTIWHWN